MLFLSVIILGIVQGITEFLPISSSAHLIIFRDVFGIGTDIPSEIALAFDVALHFGTLLAIAVYFFKDLFTIVTEGLTKGVKTASGKLFWFLGIATIPGALAGFFFEDIIEGVIRGNLYVILPALIIMGIIIYLSDKLSKTDKKLTDIKVIHAIIIGCSQAFALIPGFSRSGTTMATSRMLGIGREDSAKFSFFLSMPLILGAMAMTVLDPGTIGVIGENIVIFIMGILISFIAGLLCIEFLLRYIRKHDFKIFMWYRFVFVAIVLLFLWLS